MRQVKYFKYSYFGPITLYTGKMGSGLTLAAIIQIVKTSQSKSPPIIVSNAHLNGIEYELLDETKLMDYTEKPHLFLLDSSYRYLDCRQHMTKQNALWCYFLAQLRKRNSQVILTSSIGLSSLDKRIRDLVSSIVVVESHFWIDQTIQLTHYKALPWGNFKLAAVCEVKRAGKYWKYYDTRELPGIQSIT